MSRSPVDTIAAISTPIGAGGIGVIRISGSRAQELLTIVFHPTRQSAYIHGHRQEGLRPRRLSHGFIRRPDSGLIIDEVMAVFLPAPHTYTREDVVEIQCHGGSAVLETVLRLVVENGARIADPGEFTRRAFLSGRIDLCEAEAISDLINAKTRYALTVAALQLRGGLSQRIKEIERVLVHVMADLEARIEFCDDSDGACENDTLRGALENAVVNGIKNLIGSYETGKVAREGLQVVIVGRTNVGKSSLLNRIIREDKAIVTPHHGTTRDVVEATLFVEGIQIKLFDTAGFRQSRNMIEARGIQKSVERLRAADLVLFVIEAGQTLGKDDLHIISMLQTEKTILVINKTDLEDHSCEIPPPEACRNFTCARLSALTGDGVRMIRDSILQFYRQRVAMQDDELAITSVRHKNSLVDALDATRSAIGLLGHEGHEELAVFELRAARAALRTILGEGVDDELLDNIFLRFCVGK